MTMKAKLDALRKKEAEVQARIKATEAVLKYQARKDDTRLKVLVGAALLSDVAHRPETRQGLVSVLNRAIVADRDREFLKMKGWL
jgi:hypothetical protein